MVAVGSQLGDASVVDRRHEATQRLANPAEGDALFDRHPEAESTAKTQAAKCDVGPVRDNAE
jgi:hypothetical protein